MEHQDYDRQASDFLYLHSMEIKTAFKGDKCPSWEHGQGCIHGDRYRVTIRRVSPLVGILCQGPKSISFDFWNSHQDMRNGKSPSAYDVLAVVASDVHMPTTADEVYEEFGDMKPTQTRAIAKFAERLQVFFTESEQEQLTEIN